MSTERDTTVDRNSATLTEYATIRLERHGAALHIVLNRPEKLNSVNAELQRELLAAFVEADLDEESSVIVITGAGRAFCAGGDIGGMAGTRHSQLKTRSIHVHHPMRSFIETMLQVEKPMIAMINGAAVGLGATIALFCDITVAGTSAKIGDRHVNVGLVAGDGAASVMPDLIGYSRAKELLLTGRLVSGVEAAQMGLVNHTVADDELADFVAKLVDSMATLPAYALRATKAVVNRRLRSAVEDTLDYSLALETISKASDEHLEATRAFLESKSRS